MLQALVYQASADMELALNALQAALTLAEPEGYLSLFVHEDAPMAELLRQAERNDIAKDFIAQLLANFAENAKPDLALPVTPRVIHAATQRIEPLSKRERDLLPLLAKGLTNQEIALQLSVANSTIERHLANIYGKLQVNNRTQAVARARELNLIL